MADVTDMRSRCRQLTAQIEGQPTSSALRTVYLQLGPLVGELKGMVGERRRKQGDTEAVRAAEGALEQLERIARKVSLDMRLASPGALQIGLQSSLESALETLDCLEGRDD